MICAREISTKKKTITDFRLSRKCEQLKEEVSLLKQTTNSNNLSRMDVKDTSIMVQEMKSELRCCEESRLQLEEKLADTEAVSDA